MACRDLQADRLCVTGYVPSTFYRSNTDYEESAAQDAMQALRDAVKKSPPSRAHFQKLVTALDSNMAMTSAVAISEADRVKHLEQIVKLIPDFRTQWEFHLETNKAQRTYLGFRQRLKDLIDRDHEEDQRQMQEDAFSRQLGSRDSGKGLSGKGTVKDDADKAKPKDQRNKQQMESAEIAKIREQSAQMTS